MISLKKINNKNYNNRKMETKKNCLRKKVIKIRIISKKAEVEVEVKNIKRIEKSIEIK